MCTLEAMMLAGVPVAEAAVLEPARLERGAGFDDTAERLEDAWQLETKILALTVDEREEILRALDGAPDGLAELRGALARDREWRVSHGLR